VRNVPGHYVTIHINIETLSLSSLYAVFSATVLYMMLHILSPLVSVAEFDCCVLCLLSRAQAQKRSTCSYVTFLKFGIDFSAFGISVFDVYA
jgi:hypothetical protein